MVGAKDEDVLYRKIFNYLSAIAKIIDFNPIKNIEKIMESFSKLKIIL